MNDDKRLNRLYGAIKPTTANDCKNALFSLGRMVATAGVHKHLVSHDIDPRPYLRRHACGDWGDVPPEDAQSNELAVIYGHRILSSYQIHREQVWIITEADRSSTTFLFPKEY